MMDAEYFARTAQENSEFDHGIMPPPTKAQEGLNILIKHFLGEDWYSVNPISQEQVNTEAIYYILKKLPQRKRVPLWEFIFSCLRKEGE